MGEQPKARRGTSAVGHGRRRITGADRSVAAPLGTDLDASVTSDMRLVEAARAKDDTAIAELYRRHRESATRFARQLSDTATADDVVADAFMNVFRAIGEGGGPRDAFRPYLLTAVRNAHVNLIRRSKRLLPTDDYEALVDLTGQHDPVEAAQESELLAQAFRTLPERWQTVIWHTSVEREDHETVGSLLGLKANAVAALNFRAREGLRRAYLSAHLAAATEEACRTVRKDLPAYVRGRLAQRQCDVVDEHCRGCRKCSAAVIEISSVNTGLGAALAPALLGLAGGAYAATTTNAGAITTGPGSVGPHGGDLWPSWTESRGSVRARLRPRAPAMAVLGAAAAVVVVGIALASQADDRAGVSATSAADKSSLIREVHTSPGSSAPEPQPISTPTRTPPASPSATLSITAVPAPTSTAKPTRTTTSTAQATPTSTTSPMRPTRPPTPTASITPTAPTTPTTPTPTTPTPTTPTTPTAPTTPPVPTTTEDLGLASAQQVDYGGGLHHLQLDVRATLDPTILTFSVTDLVSYDVHDDYDFAGTSCSAGAPAGGVTTLTCSLAPGQGTFAVDVVITGQLVATAYVSGASNVDPNPADDAVTFS
jgi:RNA polymerase sigma factor (sigma-70 family)